MSCVCVCVWKEIKSKQTISGMNQPVDHHRPQHICRVCACGRLRCWRLNRFPFKFQSSVCTKDLYLIHTHTQQNALANFLNNLTWAFNTCGTERSCNDLIWDFNYLEFLNHSNVFWSVSYTLCHVSILIRLTVEYTVLSQMEWTELSMIVVNLFLKLELLVGTNCFAHPLPSSMAVEQ